MAREILILDDALIEKIVALPDKEKRDWLFLTPHPQFVGRWYVDALDQSFMFDFEDIVGKYRTVSPASLEGFLDFAGDLGYTVGFEEDPVTILDTWKHLNDKPKFSLNSDLPNTIAGMLPFQLQGFNYLRNPKNKGGYAVWDTGTGKTALVAALIKQHVEVEQAFDLVLVVVKKNNKYDMQKKLDQLGDIGSTIIDGPMRYRNSEGEWVSGQREKTYALLDTRLEAGIPSVVITNYEKFRDDYAYFEDLVDGRRVLVFWDEMPTKLSTRTTKLYNSVQSCLFDSGAKIIWDRKRPTSLRQYATSATPIEHSPLGLLNQVRLIDPELWPTIRGWENRFVAKRNYFSKEPEEFRDLDLIGLEIEFMTHQVDKSDPDIASMFPKLNEVPIYIDWGDDRRYYDKLQKIAADLAAAAKEDPKAKKFNALQVIGALQMVCDAPSMINKSAQNRDVFDELLAEAEIEDEEFELGGLTTGSEAAQMLANAIGKPLEDTSSQKMDKLHELLTVKHSDDKFIIFTAFADYIFPILEAKFDEWGVTYETFKGTDKQRQKAKDSWRTDPTIRIFLSSDAGSDSIDLPEAKVVVHYDLPWSWAKVIQRQNRAHRINSLHESVTVYTLLMAQSVEDRKVEIISRKLGFHRGIYKGEIAEEALSARMTADDLWYILTGEREE